MKIENYKNFLVRDSRPLFNYKKIIMLIGCDRNSILVPHIIKLNVV